MLPSRAGLPSPRPYRPRTTARLLKEEKSAALTSGTGKIDLTGMADAKYVRVKTAFVSDLNSTESSVPVLNEYALTAGKTKIWNTLTDWGKGYV